MQDKRFTPGQTVRCIDDTAWITHITEGHTYTIIGYLRWNTEFDEWVVQLARDDKGQPCGAFESRFEPVVEASA